jgi:hypothetical protein
MLQSISINYRGSPITIEDILQQATFLKKLKIPFLCSVGLIFALDVMKAITKQMGYIEAPSITLTSVVVLNWIVCAGGFLIYGRRIVQVLPNKFTSKVKRLTLQLTVMSVSIQISFSILTIIYILSCCNCSTYSYQSWSQPKHCSFVHSVSGYWQNWHYDRICYTGWTLHEVSTEVSFYLPTYYCFCGLCKQRSFNDTPNVSVSHICSYLKPLSQWSRRLSVHFINSFVI